MGREIGCALWCLLLVASVAESEVIVYAAGVERLSSDLLGTTRRVRWSRPSPHSPTSCTTRSKWPRRPRE